VSASLTIGPPPGEDVARLQLNWGPGYRLSVFNLGLACCTIEAIAASTRHPDAGSPHLDLLAPVEVMVVSGTVTDKMAPGVKRLYDLLPSPKRVVSFGSCSNCGGPYWDSYCVTKGVDQIIPVDVYVPGCPPRPEALLDALVALDRSLAETDATGGAR
jgi:NADH-quinone oxidoreductase subunit B